MQQCSKTMNSGIHDLSLTFGSKLMILCTGIGVQSCLAWFLGPSGRGSYAVCMVFATLLNLVFVVGCDVACIYFVSSKRFSISEGLIHVLIYGAIGSGLAIAAGLTLIQLPLSFVDKAAPTSFYLALVSIPIVVFSMTFMRLLTAVRQFGWFATMSVMHGLGHLLFTIVFVWVLSWEVNGALLAILTANMAIIVSTLLFFRWKYDLTWEKPSLESLWEMFHYGARHYIGKIGNQVNFRIGTIILALFATKEEVGLFAVASQMAAQAIMIPDAVTTILIPRVAGDKEGKRELVAQCSRLSGLVCGMLLLILAVFARPIVAVLFSRSFLPAVPLIQILAVGVVVRCACKVFVSYLVGTNRPGIASTGVAIGTVVNLVTLWLLLPVMGLPGAAIGMVAGYFVSSTFLTLGFSRFSGLSFAEIWWYRRADWAFLNKSIKRAYLRFFP
ncbi:hypothetical protein ES706_04906 [subsurface metagenome]